MLQLALEIESQALTAQREINIVKTAMAAKQRDIRMLELTSSEVKSLDKDTKLYQGVGKMLVLPVWDLEAHCADCSIQVCV